MATFPQTRSSERSFRCTADPWARGPRVSVVKRSSPNSPLTLEVEEDGSGHRSCAIAVQQSTAVRSAAHASSIRTGSRLQTRSVRWSFGMARMLSKLAAHSVDTPSSGLSDSSVGMPRTVRVRGAASTECKTEMARVRLNTRNGRRPASATSAHHTSPRSRFAHQGSSAIASWRDASADARSAGVGGERRYPSMIASSSARRRARSARTSRPARTAAARLSYTPASTRSSTCSSNSSGKRTAICSVGIPSSIPYWYTSRAPELGRASLGSEYRPVRPSSHHDPIKSPPPPSRRAQIRCTSLPAHGDVPGLGAERVSAAASSSNVD